MPSGSIRKPAMAPGMARGVDHPHRHAAAEVEQVAVAEGDGVGPGLVEERGLQVPAVLLAALRFGAEDVQKPVEVQQARQILLVDVNRSVPEQRQRRGVILVAVAEQHEVDGGQGAPAAGAHAERGVDQHRRPGAFHQQGVVCRGTCPSLHRTGWSRRRAGGLRSGVRGATRESAGRRLGAPSPAGVASRCGTRPAALLRDCPCHQERNVWSSSSSRSLTRVANPQVPVHLRYADRESY